MPKKASQPSGVLATLNNIFGDKGPIQLPSAVKEWVAHYAYVFAIIGVIIRAFGLLTLLGLGALFSGVAAAAGTFSFFSSIGLSIILLAAEGVLLLIAISGLKARKLIGWNFAFYAELVAIVGNLIGFNFIGAVISLLIGFFVLFQIRSRFSK